MILTGSWSRVIVGRSNELASMMAPDGIRVSITTDRRIRKSKEGIGEAGEGKWMDWPEEHWPVYTPDEKKYKKLPEKERALLQVQEIIDKGYYKQFYYQFLREHFYGIWDKYNLLNYPWDEKWEVARKLVYKLKREGKI